MSRADFLGESWTGTIWSFSQRGCRPSEGSKTCPQVLDHFIAILNMVPLGQRLQRVVCEPGLARLVLPDQDPERQVQTDRLTALHEWRAGQWITENDCPCRPER